MTTLNPETLREVVNQAFNEYMDLQPSRARDAALDKSNRMLALLGAAQAGKVEILETHEVRNSPCAVGERIVRIQVVRDNATGITHQVLTWAMLPSGRVTQTDVA